ncbi:hypothetical protein [Amycolatopsis sp. WGS_07]|uniref:hypothetical protein n=1 Tax=Amycolatopsis sp. WGS_07 TaxID=3076764 RepID=UPI00387316C9
MTIKAAIKDGLFGANKQHRFAVSKISEVSNTEPGAFSPGCLKFKVAGTPATVIENPASGGDKADLCTFYYSSSDKKKVRQLVEAVKAAMPQ